MKIFPGHKANFLLLGFLLFFSGCGGKPENSNAEISKKPITQTEYAPTQSPTLSPTTTSNLQAELLDKNNESTTSPIGNFDFKNYAYPLPRGWQDADGNEAVLENGQRRGGEKSIGLSYVTTKFFDVTGDGEDEAVVILKIMTAGSANPQSVYVFTWKDEKPELIWDFRTGDRADGGLKNLQAENGQLIVELYGQDRFILGDVETLKITGDEENLCCPTFFTRTRYKWNAGSFRMEGKRETYSMSDKNAAPQENLGDVVSEREKKRR